MGRLRPGTPASSALYEREPLTLGRRRVLVLEYVGDSASEGPGPRRREGTAAPP